MNAPIWVPLQAVYIIHDRQISRHGGAFGLRDATLLESACDRAQNKFFYDKADVFQCAAAYAFGICKAFAFVNGNKRTAFVTSSNFMRLNGWIIRPDAADGVHTMAGLATDAIAEAEFVSWLKRIATPISK